MTELRRWISRGDNYHWDHPDGSFIELEGCALSPSNADRYVLYNGDCARLASVRTLSAAVVKHQELAEVSA